MSWNRRKDAGCLQCIAPVGPARVPFQTLSHHERAQHEGKEEESRTEQDRQASSTSHRTNRLLPSTMPYLRIYKVRTPPCYRVRIYRYMACLSWACYAGPAWLRGQPSGPEASRAPRLHAHTLRVSVSHPGLPASPVGGHLAYVCMRGITCQGRWLHELPSYQLAYLVRGLVSWSVSRRRECTVPYYYYRYVLGRVAHHPRALLSWPRRCHLEFAEGWARASDQTKSQVSFPP
ncbi:hypothetical protein F4802DRAFT_543227 [Xylaria palmicola]|nr:hypothetical protein F4802DRAFT_543227 [Xylaria palmicola]